MMIVDRSAHPGSTVLSWLRLVLAVLVLLLIGALNAAEFTPPSNPRQVQELATPWRWVAGDPSSAWYSWIDDSVLPVLTVPHTWNNIDGQDGGNYSRWTNWYRYHLTLPAGLEGKRKFLVFDGVFLSAKIYLNNTLVGTHDGGFAAFSFDVTSLLVAGDNLIAVRVNNQNNNNVMPLAGDFTCFGGIYRPVHLVMTDPVHVSCTDFAAPGVYITPSAISAASADLKVLTKVVNDDAVDHQVTVDAAIVDGDGALVTTLTSVQLVPANSAVDVVQNTTLANPRRWQGRADPHCYRAHVTLSAESTVRDQVSQIFGVRSYSVDPTEGFRLNGALLDLHGANLHQDRIDKGWAISDADRAQDVGLLGELGATFVRLAHEQHAGATYDQLDHAGIVTWTELPFVTVVTDSTAFRDNAKIQLQELIRQNYNHPSICFWGMFNEVYDNVGTNTLVPQLVALAHAEDATRLTTCAGLQNTENQAPQSYSDVLGMNNYFGWYSGTTDLFGPWADNFHAAHPTRAFGISEYGAGGSLYQHEEDPLVPANTVTARHSEEYQALFHENFWLQLKERQYLWHKAIWNLCDFASDFRNEGDTPGRNDKGLVTFDRRTRKDAFYWYQANWTTAPMVHITGRRYVWRPSPTIDIKVYSNQPSVTLTVNGVSLGTITSPDHRFVWSDVPLSDGATVVGAQAGSGPGAVRDLVVWRRAAAQVATSIAVYPGQAVVPLKGPQHFEAVVLDQHGNPMGSQPVNFTWNGATTAYSFVLRPTTMAPGTITATALGLTGTATYAVAAPSVPAIDNVLTATAMVGVPFMYRVTATNLPTEFAAEGLPGGLMIDRRTGVLSGVPVSPGSFAIALIASNLKGGDLKTLQLSVVPAASPGGSSSGGSSGSGGGGCGLGALAAALLLAFGLRLRR